MILKNRILLKWMSLDEQANQGNPFIINNERNMFSVFTQFDVTFLKVLQIIRESLYVHRRDRL